MGQSGSSSGGDNGNAGINTRVKFKCRDCCPLAGPRREREFDPESQPPSVRLSIPHIYAMLYR